MSQPDLNDDLHFMSPRLGSSQDITRTGASSEQEFTTGSSLLFTRPVSQPKQRVFKLEDTNLLGFANNTTDTDLLAVVGIPAVETAFSNSCNPLQSKKELSPIKKSAQRLSKTVVAPQMDVAKFRPDVKRSTSRPLMRDHEILKATSLTSLMPNLEILDDPFEDSTGRLRNKVLFPKRIDKFPDEEAKMTKAVHMTDLKKLRKYKAGVSPEQKVKLIDSTIRSHIAGTNYSVVNVSEAFQRQPSADSIEGSIGVPGIDLLLDMTPPSPTWAAAASVDDRSIHSQSLQDAMMSPLLQTKRKDIVVKNIPEEKLGYYRRVGGLPIEAVPSSAPTTAPASANASVRCPTDTRSADNSAARLASRMISDVNRSGMNDDSPERPATNNPLQRFRLEQGQAERMASREPIRCCRCSKDSCFWCRQCCLSYCRECWSSVPHHGFVTEMGLPLPRSDAAKQDLPFSAFPALSKGRGSLPSTSPSREEHIPVYSPSRSSRIGASIRMLRQDKPFYKGLQISEDAVDSIDLTLFGGLEGMKGNKQPRPKSGRANSPGEWRKPVINKNNDRGVLDPQAKKKKKSKKKKVVINIPNMTAGQSSVTGHSTLSLGTGGAPPVYAYPMTGITHDFFPDEWKDTRPQIDISVYKGVPVHTAVKPFPQYDHDKPSASARTKGH